MGMTIMKHTKALALVLLLLSVQPAPSQIFELPPSETWRLTPIAEVEGFHGIAAASIDPSGNVYLADREAHQVYKINRSGFIEESVGGFGWGNTEFDRPSDVWAENGIDVYIADFGNHRVQRFDRRLSYVGTLETRNTGFDVERFGYPAAVTLNRQGDLFIADEENLRIVAFGGFNRHRMTIGGMDAGRFRISAPYSLNIFADDMILVRDGSRLLFFDQFGNPYREYSPEFLPDFRDISVDGNYIFMLLEDSILIYHDELHRPFERIRLAPYLVDPGKISRIEVNRNRIVLASADRLWIFQLHR
jgi:hypothetical protein